MKIASYFSTRSPLWRCPGHAIVCVLIALGCATSAWLAWQVVCAMDRSAPLVDVKLSLSVYDQRLHSVMQIDVSSFYRRSCYSYIKRRVYDSKGAVFVLPELTLPPSVLGPQHSVSFFPLAETFAPGEARYVSQPSYVCSWFDHLVPIRLPDRVAEFYVPPADKRAP